MLRIAGSRAWASSLLAALAVGAAATSVVAGGEEPVAAQAAAVPGAPENAIVVEILGLKTDTGWVNCALWASEEGYPKDGNRAVQRVFVAPKGNTARCRFAGHPPGTYAIAVFHDVNANHKLDTNFLGIPSEPVGASNDAKGSMGPPHFADAKFSYAGQTINLKIHLH